MEVRTKVNESDNIVERIHIREWRPAKFFHKYLKTYNSFTAIISGSRMSGKSNFVKFLMCSNKGGKLADKFDMIVIFSKTILNGHYQSFLKTKLMFPEFNPLILTAMQNKHEEYKQKGKSFKFLVIFDDMITANIKYQESITSFFYNSRHYGGSILFLTQKSSEVASGWRANTVLFVILKSLSRKEKKYNAETILADALEDILPVTTTEAQLYRIGTYLQTKKLEDFNALITTPMCKTKLKQFKAPLMKY